MTERLQAVALLVANPAGDILVLQEFVAKPHIGKETAMWSPPMETLEPGMSDHFGLQQLHTQELEGLPSIKVPGRYVGAYGVVPDAWARLYATVSTTYDLPVSVGQADVGNHQWIPPQKACGLWLRRGALEMIQDYMAGPATWPVFRYDCRQPRASA